MRFVQTGEGGRDERGGTKGEVKRRDLLGFVIVKEVAATIAVSSYNSLSSKRFDFFGEKKTHQGMASDNV